ncbi:hypothetical protein IFR05_007279 [Cadophora sp. M221]|nr:hypothetical protein IFR05_007279 [Cadophora sp. M221]
MRPKYVIIQLFVRVDTFTTLIYDLLLKKFCTPDHPDVPRRRSEENLLDPKRRSTPFLSESNYQLLVEGESSKSGTSFPPNIMEGLSTKRSVDTIAERGRRSDLKRTLEELSTLLSQECCDEASRIAYSVNYDGKLPKSQAKSKVRTLEPAIDYIKCLQNEVGGVKSSLEEISGNGSGANSEAGTMVQQPV